MIACVDCRSCEIKPQCVAICSTVEHLLPSTESGRLDAEDLERIVAGKTITNLILDNETILTPRQQEVVQLYYRESKLEREIGETLRITQQAVSDCLNSVKEGIWKMVRTRALVTSKSSVN